MASFVGDNVHRQDLYVNDNSLGFLKVFSNIVVRAFGSRQRTTFAQLSTKRLRSNCGKPSTNPVANCNWNNYHRRKIYLFTIITRDVGYLYSVGIEQLFSQHKQSASSLAKLWFSEDSKVTFILYSLTSRDDFG